MNTDAFRESELELKNELIRVRTLKAKLTVSFKQFSEVCKQRPASENQARRNLRVAETLQAASEVMTFCPDTSTQLCSVLTAGQWLYQ